MPGTVFFSRTNSFLIDRFDQNIAQKMQAKLMRSKLILKWVIPFFKSNQIVNTGKKVRGQRSGVRQYKLFQLFSYF